MSSNLIDDDPRLTNSDHQSKLRFQVGGSPFEVIFSSEF